MKRTLYLPFLVLALAGVAVPASAARILVDLGPSNDDDGRATPSPDAGWRFKKSRHAPASKTART